MSDKPQIAIYDCATGESIVRDMTDEELAVHEENIARSREHAEAQHCLLYTSPSPRDRG